MNITKQKGLITELQCQLAFSNLGFVVSQPITEDSRYDYIVDINGNLIRIQCKTCSVIGDDEAIKFSTTSLDWNTKGAKSKKYSSDEIDYFYTYYNGISYLVKQSDASSNNYKVLHFIKKNMANNISMAVDYELEIVLLNDFNCNFQYNIVNKIIPRKYYCPMCGSEVSTKDSLCRSCVHKIQRKVDRPDRDIFKEEIRTTPFRQLAKKYGISDHTIKRWCIAMGLPSMKSDINNYTDEQWKEV